MKKEDYNFDLLVIGIKKLIKITETLKGGGTGGISCALQSAKLGSKVGIIDFSKPSPLGKT